MPRIPAVVFVVFALSLGAASTVLAQSQTSADASCPAAKPPTSVYAGGSKPQSYTIPDPSDPDKTITVINLSKKSCTQSCANEGGGTVTGLCVSQDVCGAETTCSGQKPQQVTTQQVQSAVNGTQSNSGTTNSNTVVAQEFDTLPGSGAQTPASVVSQNFPSGSNLPQVSVPPSWLQQIGTTPSENASAPYANQSILTQAFNTLEGNSSGNSTESNTSVPTTPEEYLQSTFGTNPNGGYTAVATPGFSPTPCGFSCLVDNAETYVSDTAHSVWNTVTDNGTFGEVEKPEASPGYVQSFDPSMSPNDRATAIQNVYENASTLANCTTCLVVATQERVAVFSAESISGANTGTWLLQSTGNYGWNAAVNPAMNADSLSQQISSGLQQGWVTGPSGTPLPLSQDLSNGIGDVLASDYYDTPVNYRAVDAISEPNGLYVGYTPPNTSSVLPDQSAVTPEIVAANQVPQSVLNANPAANSNNSQSYPVISVEAQPLSPVVQPAPGASQESPSVSQSSPSEQPPGQTQEAGSQLPAQSAPEPLSQSGQPPAQTSQQPDNPGNDQAGGQQKPSAQAQIPGATGANPANQGGTGQTDMQAVAGFFGGLLKGFARASTPSAATQPMVYSATAPIVMLPATSEGVLGPCQTATQTNPQQPQQSPCGATSNVPSPQLVTSLPAAHIAQGTGAAAPPAQQTNPNIPQTVALGTTQTGTGSNSTQTSGPPPTSQQGGNNTPVNPQGTQPGPTGTSNPTGTQQGGTGAPATTPGNGSSQPTSNPAATPPATQQQPAPSTPQKTSGQGNGTGSGIGNGSQPGVQAPGSNATNCQTISCWAQQQLNNVKKALQSPGKALADIFSVGSANAAQPEYQSDIDKLKADVQTATGGLDVFKSLTGEATVQQKATIGRGIAAAQRLAGATEGNLKSRLNTYVSQIGQLQKIAQSCNNSPTGSIPCMLNKGAYGISTAVKDTGDQLLTDTSNYINGLKPAVTVGRIGTPSASPPSTAGQTTSGETPPPAPAQPSPRGTPAAETKPVAPAVPAAPPGNINNVNDRHAVAQTVNQLLRTQGIRPSDLVPGSPNYAQAWKTVIDTTRQVLASRGMLNSQLDAASVLALARREQDIPGNTSVSSTGVRGALQVTTGTALATLGYSSFATWQGTWSTQLFATQDNIGSVITGTILFDQLLYQYNGNIAAAAQSYNSGSPYSCIGGSCTYGRDAAVDTAVMRNALANGGSNVSAVAQQLNGLTGNRSKSGAALADYASILVGSGAPISCSYRGCAATATIQPGNPGYAPGISRVAQCPSSGLCYSDPQTGAFAVPSDSSMTQQQFLQAAREDDAMERLAQQNKLPQGAQFQNFKATLTTPSGIAVTPSTQAGQSRLASELAAGTNIPLSQAQQIVASNPTSVVAAINAISTGTNVQSSLTAIGLDANTQTNQQALQTAISQNSGVSTTGAVQNFTYTITDQNGQVVAQNVPLPQGAVDSDGTVRLLADSSGNPLDANGSQLKDGEPPLQISSDATLPNPTPSQTNPTQYSFPDTRPLQPVPSPTSPYTSTVATQQVNQGYCLVSTQPVVAVPCSAAAQPRSPLQQPLMQQAYPQPIQQPLPYPASASPNQQNPMVNIVANPRSVASGKTSTITWNSLGTTQCNVVSSTGTTLSSTSTKGTIVSPQLSATTVFTAFCQAQITTTVGVANTTISASTSVTVQ